MENKLGSTGNFPDGKLDSSDEGELKIAMGIFDNTLIIDFGKPTSWIGLTKNDVKGFISTLTNLEKQLT